MISNKVWKNGSVLAVWLKGDNKQELLQNYWSYWNHGATSADDLHWVNEMQGYFWTSARQLKRYFKNSSRAIVLNELGEDWQGDAQSGVEVSERIAAMAEERYQELMSNDDGPNPYNPRVIPFVYEMGTIDTGRTEGGWQDFLVKQATG